MMKSIATMLLFVLAAANIEGQTNNPPSPTTQQKKAKKLSRSEKKALREKLPETYTAFLVEVEPIITDVELDEFLRLGSDIDRDSFIENFWRRRDPDKRTTLNEYRERYVESLAEAKSLFNSIHSDRSRVYLHRGRPDDRLVSSVCVKFFWPFEIWRYSALPETAGTVLLIFYADRGDYRLWNPNGEGRQALLNFNGQQKGEPVWYEISGEGNRGVGNRGCPEDQALLDAVASSESMRGTISKITAAPIIPEDQRASSAIASATPAIDDVGVRKLSRRERKERRKNLVEKYQQFLTDVEPIMLDTELHTFLILESDAQRDLYIEEFWRRRDTDPKTVYNEYRVSYTERVAEVKTKFKNVISDRSKTYLIHGRPDEMVTINCERYLQPIEIWRYDHLPGMGQHIQLLFFVPRNQFDHKLWLPLGNAVESLEELLSFQGQKIGAMEVFYGGGDSRRLQFECMNGDAIHSAIAWMQTNKFDAVTLFTPPKIEEEDINKILRSSVIANPAAAKLDTTITVKFPGKRGARTSVEMTLLLSRAQLRSNEVNGQQFYNLDVVGEILKDEKLFESYRYRYDYLAENAGDTIPVVIERFLRPADYLARVKVIDANSGAEAVLEKPIEVPYIEADVAKVAQEKESMDAIDLLQQEFRRGESRLRIVPIGDDLLTGIHHVDTIVTGGAIRAVEFYLDGKKIMVKRSPPYTLDLDLGNMPKMRKIKVIGLDEKGSIVGGDEVVVNTGVDPFRVRIASPRVAQNLSGKVRVEIEANVPEGKELDHIELYFNEAKLATLYQPPFVQTVVIPSNSAIGYLRAVAFLKDESNTSVEDLVFVNTPEFLEEVDVHLVELPTTVYRDGRAVTDLPESSFKVLDEGKPAKIAKFEYVKDLPLSIGLAIDSSGSMKNRMPEAQKAGGQFFKNVLRSGDKAFLMSFDDHPAMIQKWTRTLTDLNAGLASVRAEESTALYDAVILGLYNFQGLKGQKAFVLISDGKDTASKFTFDQTLEYARRAAVPIYIIGIGIRPADIDAKYKMGRLASETGGNAYYIDQAGDLGRIYIDIQNELRSQYIVGIYPPEGVKSGAKWRDVDVRVDGAKTKTITGYYP